MKTFASKHFACWKIHEFMREFEGFPSSKMPQKPPFSFRGVPSLPRSHFWMGNHQKWESIGTLNQQPSAWGSQRIRTTSCLDCGKMLWYAMTLELFSKNILSSLKQNIYMQIDQWNMTKHRSKHENDMNNCFSIILNYWMLLGCKSLSAEPRLSQIHVKEEGARFFRFAEAGEDSYVARPTKDPRFCEKQMDLWTGVDQDRLVIGWLDSTRFQGESSNFKLEQCEENVILASKAWSVCWVIQFLKRQGEKIYPTSKVYNYLLDLIGRWFQMLFIFNNICDSEPIFRGLKPPTRYPQTVTQDGLAAVLHQAGPPSGGEVGKVMVMTTVMVMVMVVMKLIPHGRTSTRIAWNIVKHIFVSQSLLQKFSPTYST